tara:strand:+ start:5777 stop:6661 length:885 start_codon:yes stop_codon:yes gene_type:complete
MLDEIDYKMTKFIYNIFNDTPISELPHYLGLIPYEFYVIPGMYIAILQVIWLGTPNPVQFHLLPHWFSYSIFQFLKKTIKRKRPGCFHKDLGKYINASHCKHGHELQSFPSGHTGVAFSLATALYMEMHYSENPHFFEMPINNPTTQRIISTSGILVAAMVALHRVSKGYHSFIDVFAGELIGISIGFISWITLNHFKKSYYKTCEEKNKNEPGTSGGSANKTEKSDSCDNYNKRDDEFTYWTQDWGLFKSKLYDSIFVNKLTGITRIILTIPILYLLIKFLTKDVYRLASIKH